MEKISPTEVVTKFSFVCRLKNVLEFSEDMVIVIPKIWQYLGELIGPMVQDGSVPLNFLKSACEPCGKAATLVAEVLHDAARRLVRICTQGWGGTPVFSICDG